MLKIYDTKKRAKVDFVPYKKGKVRLYVCGVTVYDRCHVGHARVYVVFDLVVRYFEYLGYQVRYVRNVTDIDDKIIEKAKKIKGDEDIITKVHQITHQFTEAFHEDMRRLGLRLPEEEPKATEHIPEMIQLIEKLLAVKAAYQVNGDVYFDIEHWEAYGALSQRDIHDLQAGARIEPDDKKKNPLDFVLWKETKEGEPAWESPWGKGRPGWHVECSAMSLKYLGAPFDIHGGGQDLIFPHHENELAQSQAAANQPIVRYWMHNGFVTLNKQKMSKSLGNFFVLKDVFKKFPPQLVHFYLMSQHYRSPIEFSDVALQEAQESFKKIQNCITLTELFLEGQVLAPLASKPKALLRFEEEMNDDFNTPRVLALIFELVQSTNKARESDHFTESAKEEYLCLKKILEVLGLEAHEEVLQVKEQSLTIKDPQSLLSQSSFTQEELEQLVQYRQQVRLEKKFQLADQIRDKIQALGYFIEDTPKGQRLRKQ